MSDTKVITLLEVPFRIETWIWLLQEYPELVDDYQRARLAKDRDYENWLAQEYYRQLQEA